jgi:hypothetical protein
MERRYGSQCDAFEASMYTAVTTANQNLLETCEAMRADLMDEWYLLLVEMTPLVQSDTVFAGVINQSFLSRPAASLNPPSDLVTNTIPVATMPANCGMFDSSIAASESTL